MNSVRAAFRCLLGIALLGILAPVTCSISRAQSAPIAPVTEQNKPASAASSGPAPANFPQAPLVVEHFFTTVEFQNDGTNQKTVKARIRVQSDVGAQQLSQLIFPYNSPNEHNEVHFVRVLKSDGKIIGAASDAIRNVDSPIVHDAPAFSGLKETHVAVSSLSPGDVLEYEVVTRTITPQAPGQFWLQLRFLDRAIVLNEQLTVIVPQSRMVNIKSTGFHFAARNDEAHHHVVYEWKHAHLARPVPDDDPNSSSASNNPLHGGKPRPPDVELTTFSSWQQVARWYSEIEQNRVTPTPEIKTKALEITRGSENNPERIEALYNYVSTNVRYVSLPFGEPAYQPHSAADVFSNQYGDSNDKAVLLAAMLQSVGIRAGAALISSSRDLDESFPSPAQFDHVLTAVPLENAVIWMDEAPEVAPFRMLAASLRHKSAVLISSAAPSTIAKTPADPPFTSTQDAQIEGSVSDLGKLSANVHYTLRGDTELVLRLAFHRTPKDQWKQLAETILNLDGIHGEVASVTPSDPTATKNPFNLDITFTQVNFIDWSSANQRVTLPLAAMGLPDAPTEKSAPIEFGSPLDVTTKIHLTLPSAFTAQPPAATAIARDYANFKSSYRFEDHALDAERSLTFKTRELPASRAGDYAAFALAVQADENQKIIAANSAADTLVVPASASLEELLESGIAALNSGNPRAAMPLFQRVVTLDPQHKEVWDEIGLASLSLGHLDAAAAAFRKQIEVNPSTEHSFYYLGLTLQQQRKTDDAVLAFRKQLEIDPLDKSALAALGAVYLDERDYASALPVLDKATILSPDNAGLFISLGRAYAATGDTDKVLAALKRAVNISPAPRTLNAAAHTLADYKLDLAEAHQYAVSAISQTSDALREMKLSQLKNEDLSLVSALGNYWDTLGWIFFQQGNLKSAEDFLRAAWLLDERSETADHLAQMYARRGEKDQAMHMYALALAAPHPDPETRARLTLLLAGNAGIDELVAKAQPQLEAMRTIPVTRIATDHDRNGASAEFLILLSPGKLASPGKNTTEVVDVEFIGGNENLRDYVDRLRLLDYGAVFPDASPAQIMRRGTLTCPASSSKSAVSTTEGASVASTASAASEAPLGCVLVLRLPEDTRVAN